MIAKHTGVSPDDVAALTRVANEIGLETAGKHPDVIKNEVFDARVQDNLAGPIFVIDYPASICPLTKRKADEPAIAERFELFVVGMELANAYTELNDPDYKNSCFARSWPGWPTRLDGQDGSRFHPRLAS